MKSDILVTLIKEVVKNEVKQQVKEEIAKLIKSGKVVLGNSSVQQVQSALASKAPQVTKTKQLQTKQPVREITKNPIINEILNQTEPFTAAHRVDSGHGVGATDGSILDTMQPTVSMEGDWETMDYRGKEMPHQPTHTPISDNAGVDALAKALTRDYSELVKRFK